jgi:hypothetical protein
MNRRLKERIYNETLRQYIDWYGAEHGANGSCLYWSLTAGLVLQRHGIRSILQAGTMLWPMAEDTGTNETHFGYQWDPTDIGSQAALEVGAMPEIHIWIVLPETQEIIDFSVRHLPRLAALDGKTWTKETPPDFLWVKKEQMPDGVIYRAEVGATLWLIRKLAQDGYVKSNELSDHKLIKTYG